MAQKLKREIAETKEHLKEARQIAASLERNPRLHRLAMNAVFVLEDYLFELQTTLTEGRGLSPRD